MVPWRGGAHARKYFRKALDAAQLSVTMTSIRSPSDWQIGWKINLLKDKKGLIEMMVYDRINQFALITW